ncbi:MAG: hypothetical protein B6A08_09575 [Sorangiineae bacterium NIC37A_2]|jgi:predicted phosphodiesterase|nr:MAG: hypothetical protein B6A08_09575 [Sorangiineae bacterium NIC37A_2]
MRFLCISDIQGNVRALQTLLEEADARGFDQLIVCGDICWPGEDPLEVWKILAARNAVCVQGLGDRALATIDAKKLAGATPEERARVERLKTTKRELGELILARLAKLPPIVRLPLESGHTMVVVHGSPRDPTSSITRDMTEEELMYALGDEPGDLVICGSSHEQFEGKVGDVHIASVGSVGEAPGGTHALGAFVDSGQLGYQVTFLEVPLTSS